MLHTFVKIAPRPQELTDGEWLLWADKTFAKNITIHLNYTEKEKLPSPVKCKTWHPVWHISEMRMQALCLTLSQAPYHFLIDRHLDDIYTSLLAYLLAP